MNIKPIIFLLTLILAATNIRGEENVLMDKYNEAGVAESFRMNGEWIPYPKYSDRDAWKKLIPSSYAKALVKTGEKYLGYQWRLVPAKAWIAVVEEQDKKQMSGYSTGNRAAFISLALAELAEGRGRFLQDLANGFWFYASANDWSIANEIGGKKLPSSHGEVIALGNAKISATVCYVYQVFKEEFDKIDPQINKTFKETIHRIIIDPFLNPQNKYWWLGEKPETRRLNNWTPWCSHGVILAFLTVEENPDNVHYALKRCIKGCDRYLRDYSQDGMCAEGATYWFQSVARLQEYLQLMKDASGGRFDILPNPLTTRMCTYVSRAMAGQTAKGKEIVANFGDGGAFKEYDVFQLWKCGRAFDSQELLDLAVHSSYTGKKFSMPAMEKAEGYRAFENIRWAKDLRSALDKANGRLSGGESIQNILSDLRSNVPAYTWYDKGEQAFIKTKDNWFIALKGGYNHEPHNHNDVGTCILYCNGVPILIDAGVGEYTTKTFSSERYTIWSMTAAWHNIPVINGEVEQNGHQFKATGTSFAAVENIYTFSTGIHTAYSENAACSNWTRRFRLTEGKKGSALEISDSFVLTERKASDEEHFLVNGNVKLAKAGTVLIEKDGITFEMTYPEKLLSFSITEQTELDDKLQKTWGPVLTRINLRSKNDAPLQGEYVIKFERMYNFTPDSAVAPSN